jgi:glycosyltransferase involved in cell wall biosynthesis
MSSYSLTIAIVTKDRPDSLRRLLVSLRPQLSNTIEVMISDDSLGENAARTRRLAESFGCRYIGGPRRGLYANRNASAVQASSTHIRTMDDDHELPPGHIEACLAAIARDPDAVWTLSELRPGDPTGDGRGIPPGQLTARGFSAPPGPGEPCWAIADGATIYPRSIFMCGHWFVEDFPYGAAYLEFGSRLYRAGFRIRHLQETYVVHHWVPRQASDSRAELSSNIYAMLAHTLVQCPCWRNRALMSVEIMKQLVLHPITGPAALRWGVAVYNRHAPMLRDSLATSRSM